jgi:hypothetical protein
MHCRVKERALGSTSPTCIAPTALAYQSGYSAGLPPVAGALESRNILVGTEGAGAATIRRQVGLQLLLACTVDQ